MQESTTYQRILREGLQEGLLKGRQEGSLFEARRILLRQGAWRFGEASPEQARRIEAITNLAVLEELADRILDPSVVDWESSLDLGRGRSRRRAKVLLRF